MRKGCVVLIVYFTPGVWCSSSHPERWAAQAGGHYWRIAGDSYDGWSSVLRQWDVAFSIPNIDRFSHKGEHNRL